MMTEMKALRSELAELKELIKNMAAEKGSKSE